MYCIILLIEFSITAKYIGDINFKSSTSPASTITVINSVPEQQLSHETSTPSATPTPSVTPISPTVTPTTQKEETHSFLSSLINLLTRILGFFYGILIVIGVAAGAIVALIELKGYLDKK